MCFAKRLPIGPREEQHQVAMVIDDVVDDSGFGGSASLKAPDAQWVLIQERYSSLAPGCGFIEVAVGLGFSAAVV